MEDQGLTSGKQLYDNYINAYIAANPNVNKAKQLSDGQKAWNGKPIG